MGSGFDNKGFCLETLNLLLEAYIGLVDFVSTAMTWESAREGSVRLLKALALNFERLSSDLVRTTEDAALSALLRGGFALLRGGFALLTALCKGLYLLFRALAALLRGLWYLIEIFPTLPPLHRTPAILAGKVLTRLLGKVRGRAPHRALRGARLIWLKAKTLSRTTPTHPALVKCARVGSMVNAEVEGRFDLGAHKLWGWARSILPRLYHLPINIFRYGPPFNFTRRALLYEPTPFVRRHALKR